MGKFLLIWIIAFGFTTDLFALYGLKRYQLVLGEFKNRNNAQKCMYKFSDTDAHIVKYKNRYRVIIGNIYGLEEAKGVLQKIRKREKDAYLLPQNQNNKSSMKIDNSSKKYQTKSNIKNVQKNKKKKVTKTLRTKQKVAYTQIASTNVEERFSKHNQNEGLHLSDAIKLALQNSYKVMVAKERVEQAKEKVKQKLAAFYPKIDLYANGGGSYLKPYQKPEVKFWRSDESLIVTQNIYSGGRDSNLVKQERENLKVAIAKYRDKVEEESQKVIEAYLSLLYEKKAIDKARENMKSLQKILKIVKIKTKNGAATKGDLNYIKSQVDNAKAALVKVKSKYQNAISYYEYFVGKLDSSKMPIDENFDIKLDREEQVLESAYQYNAKIEAAKSKLKANEYALKAQKGKFRPKLDFTITGKDKQSGYLSEPQEDRATAMLNLSYNLYNGGKDRAKMLEIKSKSRELKYNLIDIQKGLLHNIEQLYENVLSTKDTLKHTIDEVESNRKVVTSYWSAFKYGNQDLQALILAQRSLNRSQLDAIKQEQAYINSYFKLLKETGELLKFVGIESF